MSERRIDTDKFVLLEVYDEDEHGQVDDADWRAHNKRGRDQ